MRRTRAALRGNQRKSLFHRNDWSRLLAAGSMLVALTMAIATASRPETWRWLAQDENATAPQRDPDVHSEKIVAGPNDLDANEQAASKQEMTLIADNRPLTAEEMPAYWRLLRWVRSQSQAAMRQRSTPNVYFTQLFESPQRQRGKLVHLQLHLARSLALPLEDTSGAPRDCKQLFEAWGPTAESVSNPYVVVFPDPPADFPIGPKIAAAAEFDGYFLKLMAYRSADDKWRTAPLLIGRIDYRPSTAINKGLAPPQSFWLLLAALGFLGLRWIAWPLLRPRTIPPVVGDDQTRRLEQWLADGASEGPAESPAN